MSFKVGVEKAYGRLGFGRKLYVHIGSRMMGIVVTDGILSRIADIRHGDGKRQIVVLKSQQ
jgi:hypothetical protein